MTELKDRPKRLLEKRRASLLQKNIEHLRLGYWTKYARNCQRIARISEELNRRESLQRQMEAKQA